MNHKQKLGYMALGAGILVLGIIIGQFVTPDIEAQNNGVFDEIICTKLTVANNAGTHRIELVSEQDQTMIRLTDRTGTPQIGLRVSDDSNSIMVMNKRNRGIGIWLISSEESDNQILLFHPDKADNSQQITLRSHADERSLITLGLDREIALMASKKSNTVYVGGKVGQESINLWAFEEESPSFFILDRTGNVRWGSPQ